jgi:hypothetical protein
MVIWYVSVVPDVELAGIAYCRSDTLLEEQSRTVSEPAGEIGSIDFFGPRGSSLAPESLLCSKLVSPNLL